MVSMLVPTPASGSRSPFALHLTRPVQAASSSHKKSQKAENFRSWGVEEGRDTSSHVPALPFLMSSHFKDKKTEALRMK